MQTPITQLIEWLEKEISDDYDDPNTTAVNQKIYESIRKSKELLEVEREVIIKAYYTPMHLNMNETGEDYYNEKFKTN